ncbi:Uncharacterized iron-regulated membrane protein [Sphingomonas sp. OV641]|nr:Uncharacterized iron-regulated membrane protein [Sphingomonas sp. OV641]
MRLAVRRVHLWLGLTLGLLFAVIGATGSALVFYTAIDAALHPVVGAGARALRGGVPARDVAGLPRLSGGGGGADGKAVGIAAAPASEVSQLGPGPRRGGVEEGAGLRALRGGLLERDVAGLPRLAGGGRGPDGIAVGTAVARASEVSRLGPGLRRGGVKEGAGVRALRGGVPARDVAGLTRLPGEGRGPGGIAVGTGVASASEVSQLGPGLRRGWAAEGLGERLDRAFATGSARFRHPGGKWTFEVTGGGGAIPARYYPAAMPGHHAERLMVWFSPDGGRIVRVERWGGYLMSWIYQLHMELLAGEAGLQIVGWSGVVMLVLLVSGVVAWWPRGSWRKALAFKRDAAPIRRLRDLHKLSGVGSALLLVVLVVTGVLLALPNVMQALLAPGKPAVPASAEVPAGARPVSIVQALDAAQRALPDGRLVFVDMPIGGSAPIRARYQVPGDPHARFPASYVYLDQVTGRVLGVHDARRGGVGAQVNLWVRALHDGTVGGMATRVLALLMGLMPAVLFVTGLMHWLRRRRQARRCSTL